MRLTYLTNHVSPYRVSTLAALSRLTDGMNLLLTGSESAPELEREPIRIVKVPSLQIARVRRHPAGYDEKFELHVPLGTLGALLREESWNVFSVELGLRTAFAALWRKFGRNRRLIVHADLSEATERGRGYARLLLRRLLLRHVDRVLVNGASGARYLQTLGCPPDRIGRLPYASDIAHFQWIPDLPAHADNEGPLRLLYVGRLVEVKGLVPFLDRLANALRARPRQRVSLTLVGDGDLAAAIDAVDCPANLTIQRIGAIPYEQVPDHYARADVVVMPSLGDTWGLCVNEAMASGRPVLGSVGAQAVDELVIDGVTGWRFDMQAPLTLDNAIARMLASTPAERAALGRNARRTAAAFSPERIAVRIIDAFQHTRGLPPISEAIPPATEPAVSAAGPRRAARLSGSARPPT